MGAACLEGEEAGAAAADGVVAGYGGVRTGWPPLRVKSPGRTGCWRGGVNNERVKTVVNNLQRHLAPLTRLLMNDLGDLLVLHSLLRLHLLDLLLLLLLFLMLLQLQQHRGRHDSVDRRHLPLPLLSPPRPRRRLRAPRRGFLLQTFFQSFADADAISAVHPSALCCDFAQFFLLFCTAFTPVFFFFFNLPRQPLCLLLSV